MLLIQQSNNILIIKVLQKSEYIYTFTHHVATNLSLSISPFLAQHIYFITFNDVPQKYLHTTNNKIIINTLLETDRAKGNRAPLSSESCQSSFMLL